MSGIRTRIMRLDGKKLLLRAGAALGALLVLFAGAKLLLPGGEPVSAAQAQRNLPIYSVETSEKKVAISFDAAWGAKRQAKSWTFWRNITFKRHSIWLALG